MTRTYEPHAHALACSLAMAIADMPHDGMRDLAIERLREYIEDHDSAEANKHENSKASFLYHWAKIAHMRPLFVVKLPTVSAPSNPGDAIDEETSHYRFCQDGD